MSFLTSIRLWDLWCFLTTSERYCPVSQPRSLTLTRSNLSTTGPHKPVMPTRSSFQHAKAWFTSSSETNKSVSEILRLNDACPSDATSAHTLPPESEDRPSESMVQSASLSSFQSWSSSAEVSSNSVDPSNFQCCGFGLLPLRSCASGKHVLVGALHTARSSSMGSQETIPRTAPSPKRCTEPMNRSNSKQHALRKPPSEHQGS